MHINYNIQLLYKHMPRNIHTCNTYTYLHTGYIDQPAKNYDTLTWGLVLCEFRDDRSWHILAHTCTYMHIFAIHAIHAIHADTCIYLQIHTHTCFIPTFGIPFLVHQYTKNMTLFRHKSKCLAHGCLEGLRAKFEVAWMILEDAMLVSRQSKTHE